MSSKTPRPMTPLARPGVPGQWRVVPRWQNDIVLAAALNLRGLRLVRFGSERALACGPPPPFVAPLASSLRTHFRGDPPRRAARRCRRRSAGRARSRSVRFGGACGPPPPFAAPLASSLRAHFRGDPPLFESRSLQRVTLMPQRGCSGRVSHARVARSSKRIASALREALADASAAEAP